MTLEFLQTLEPGTIAEIGIDKGDTSLAIASWLNHAGKLHLFDRTSKVSSVSTRLGHAGYSNIVGHGNSDRILDSYNWRLMSLIKENRRPIFDYIYLDGAHTWHHDGFAFLLCDRLLKKGGYIDFDDYDWSYAISPTVNPTLCPEIRDLYTDDQIQTKQVALVIDLLVKRDPRYSVIVENRIYRKMV